MLLPNKLPAHLRNSTTEQPSSIVDQLQIDRKRMGRKKKLALDRAEMLAPTATPTTSTQQQPTQKGSFVARSWARISGRRRKQRFGQVPNWNNNEEVDTEQQMGRSGNTDLPAIEITLQAHRHSGRNGGPTWPTTNNLAQLGHLAENGHATELAGKRHLLNRGMDRIRRSIRRSLHRGHPHAQALTQSTDAHPPHSSTSNGTAGHGTTSSTQPNKNYCHGDEIAVRSAACSFAVKYLGAYEVHESRGMSVCEMALQQLRARKRGTKALLYISGDGIRVVDQEHSRGLIVDQTIEKVSFCAPDRHNDKGFAYICRDGATRRWMCHGFHATKDMGERLSHAVGCAFTVCLEKKRKRDAESAAYRNAQALAQSLNASQDGEGDQFARTNQAYRSFRQLSITERRCDPQKAILVTNATSATSMPMITNNIPNNRTIPPTPSDGPTSTTAIVATPRPSANPNLFERTASMRGPQVHAAPIVPLPGPKPVFSRFNSLPPASHRPSSSTKVSLYNEPIWEGDDDFKAEEQQQQATNPAGNTGVCDWANWGNGVDAKNNFYRTMPHTVPSLAQLHSWSPSIPPTIPEEEKQIPTGYNLTESPSPADPFHHTPIYESTAPTSCRSARADDWLEQALQRAGSLQTLQNPAGTNWVTRFPHSQSFGTACDWPDGGRGSNGQQLQRPMSMASMDSACTLAPQRQFSADETVPDSATPTSAASTSRVRKASRQIEYQLLQEEHPAQSPPKGPSVLERSLAKADDPFDIDWSQRVLDQTSKLLIKSPEKSVPADNPFNWESPSVDV